MPRVIKQSKSAKRQATILTPEAYARTKRPIPEIWRKVAGSLKSKRIKDPVAWQRRIRRESDEHRDELIRRAVHRDD